MYTGLLTLLHTNRKKSFPLVSPSQVDTAWALGANTARTTEVYCVELSGHETVESPTPDTRCSRLSNTAPEPHHLPCGSHTTPHPIVQWSLSFCFPLLLSLHNYVNPLLCRDSLFVHRYNRDSFSLFMQTEKTGSPPVYTDP